MHEDSNRNDCVAHKQPKQWIVLRCVATCVCVCVCVRVCTQV